MLTGGYNSPYKLLLVDYTITNSIINKDVAFTDLRESDGTVRRIQNDVPAEVLAIRYKHILRTIEDMYGNEEYEFEKVKRRDGSVSNIDAEFYSYTGSKVLIDQAKKDFGHDDLPCPTVIQEFETNTGKKFFKFT